MAFLFASGALIGHSSCKVVTVRNCVTVFSHVVFVFGTAFDVTFETGATTGAGATCGEEPSRAVAGQGFAGIAAGTSSGRTAEMVSGVTGAKQASMCVGRLVSIGVLSRGAHYTATSE